MKEKLIVYRYWLAGAGIVFIGIVFVLFQFSFVQSENRIQKSEEWYQSSSTIEETPIETAGSIEEMYVDVKGAVVSPGIYLVSPAMRVWDVLQLAGGMKEQADEKQINFSQKLADQMVIYVPEIGEEHDYSLPEIADASENEDGKINLNTADEQKLMTLSGIGQKKAQDIISYREAHGKFASLDELVNITGIGEKTIDRLRDYLFVS